MSAYNYILGANSITHEFKSSGDQILRDGVSNEISSSEDIILGIGVTNKIKSSRKPNLGGWCCL